MVDPSLLRPGRFDSLIALPSPDGQARREILKAHTRNLPLAEDVNLESLVEAMEGFVGSDIAAVCKKAGMLAIRDFLAAGAKPDRDYHSFLISQRHLQEALANLRRQINQTGVGHVTWDDKENTSSV
jgi:transitional endoplasmic reticulum ATPase